MSPCWSPKPGEIRLWSDTLVRALFDDSHDAARTIGRARRPAGTAHHASRRACARSRARDWERAWLEGLEADALRPAALGVPDGRRAAG